MHTLAAEAGSCHTLSARLIRADYVLPSSTAPRVLSSRPIALSTSLMKRQMDMDSLADPAIRSLNGTTLTLPQPVKNFAWADGHWAFYSTCPTSRIRLVNLLYSPDMFSEVKMVKNALMVGLRRGPLIALARYPLAGLRDG